MSAKWGLLAGLGQGMNQAGDFMMRSKADELKEQRLRQYQLDAEARSNKRADEKEAATIAREEAGKVTNSYYGKDENGNEIQYGKNKAGEIVSQAEVKTDPKAQWGIDKFGRRYNKYTGEITGEAIIPAGKMDDTTKQEFGLFSRLAGKETRTEQEESMFNALSQKFGYSDGAQSGISPDALSAAEEYAQDKVSSTAGWLSGDGDDFKAFGGDRNTALEFYKAQRLAEMQGKTLTPAQFMGAPGGEQKPTGKPSLAQRIAETESKPSPDESKKPAGLLSSALSPEVKAKADSARKAEIPRTLDMIEGTAFDGKGVVGAALTDYDGAISSLMKIASDPIATPAQQQKAAALAKKIEAAKASRPTLKGWASGQNNW
jgi:hypothetical protein